MTNINKIAWLSREDLHEKPHMACAHLLEDGCHFYVYNGSDTPASLVLTGKEIEKFIEKWQEAKAYWNSKTIAKGEVLLSCGCVVPWKEFSALTPTVDMEAFCWNHDIEYKKVRILRVYYDEERT